MPYSASGCSLYGSGYWYPVPWEEVGVGEVGVPGDEGAKVGGCPFDCPERVNTW